MTAPLTDAEREFLHAYECSCGVGTTLSSEAIFIRREIDALAAREEEK